MQMGIGLIGLSTWRCVKRTSGELLPAGLMMGTVNAPINETPASLPELRNNVRWLKGGKDAGVCNISSKTLKQWCKVMIHRLYMVLFPMWQFRDIPPDWKRRLVVLVWKRKRIRQNCKNYWGITLFSILVKVIAYWLLMRISFHLLKFQRLK